MVSADQIKTCWICLSNNSVDDHHYDCREGQLSRETVPLCRRCHRTYHDLGVDWFDDEYLDKAIELENKRREILRRNNIGRPLPMMKRDDVRRSDYFNQTHGLRAEKKEAKGSRTPVFNFHLPRGEPLCGWDWVNKHLYDLIDWVPRIEIIHPSLSLIVDINNKKKLTDVIKAIRGLRRSLKITAIGKS